VAVLLGIHCFILEHGLVICESTFGGLARLAGTRNTGLMDYGSLIWVTLQRSRTAREAIQTMAQLVSDYGYASTGESFSIADQEELWYLELIGKGRYAKGAVWVARRVPEGYVSGHANQARITTFPLNDPENCVYSSDVISFAREIGLYDGADEDFSFSDTYDPVNFDGARFCEARVWSFFSRVMGKEWSDQYLDYAQGYNLTNRMPLWVKPTYLLSPQEVMESMRNHYEGTALDNTGKLFPDVGAAQFYLPNRNSPITWTAPSYPANEYFHERTIAQPPTGWSIVCQSRPNVPRQMAALMWFGIDDSSTSVHFPVYGSVTRVPEGWAGPGPQDGATPPLMEFSLDSAFYVFNLVANFAYSRWDAIYADVHSEIVAREARYFSMVAEADAKALNMFGAGQDTDAVEYLTEFTNDIGRKLLRDWFKFFGQLFVKYRDGFVTTANKKVPVCGCDTSSLRYDGQWYDRIAADTGDRYILPQNAADRTTIRKQDLRSFN
jgi:dipeptidase